MKKLILNSLLNVLLYVLIVIFFVIKLVVTPIGFFFFALAMIVQGILEELMKKLDKDK
jgi:hypothetical protein